MHEVAESTGLLSVSIIKMTPFSLQRFAGFLQLGIVAIHGCVLMDRAPLATTTV
jgi:hypothetical protein